LLPPISIGGFLLFGERKSKKSKIKSKKVISRGGATNAQRRYWPSYVYYMTYPRPTVGTSCGKALKNQK
jgi:hypothetical protein